MLFTSQHTNKYNTWSLYKQNHSKGKSVQNIFYKSKTPIIFKYKKLCYTLKWNGGRNVWGRRVLFTRGKKISKTIKVFVNYKFRNLHLFFISSFFFDKITTKLLSVIILSSGTITYINTTTYHKLLTFNKFLSPKTHKSLFFYFLYFNICYVNGILIFFKKFKYISLIELFPYKGIQYIRSSGTCGLFLRLDIYTKLSLIKLPSGVKKIFSIYSISSIGSVSLKLNKYKKNNHAGFIKQKGKTSITRGVAMNPVDHPHGGRTKAIKYQRTPWGKTTKYK